jgi:hypothetical protein
MLVRVFKDHKSAHPEVAPNMCTIATELAHRISNIRMCPLVFEQGLRDQVARFCANAITRLMVILNRLCPNLLSVHTNTVHTKNDYVVTGLLYLMRAGLNVHSVTLLPSCPALHYLLPLESCLLHFFGIKSKCVTEIENMVKVNIRSIDRSSLQRFGMSSVDEVLWKA